MNQRDKRGNQSLDNDWSNGIIACWVTMGKGDKKKHYKEIISGLLPQALKEDKDNPDEMAFILRKWDSISDNDSEIKIKTISNLLENAIKGTKLWPWILRIISVGSILILVIVGGYILDKSQTNVDNQIPIKGKNPETPTPSKDCVKEHNCIIITNANLKDDYSLNFDTGELVVKLIENGTAEERIGIRHQEKAEGIGIDGSNIFYKGKNKIIGSFEGGVGIEPLKVTFNSNAKRESVEALIHNITYENLGENPIEDRQVEFKISDGDGGSTTNTFKIFVNPEQIDLTLPSEKILTPSSSEQVQKAIEGIQINSSDSENRYIKVTLTVEQGTLLFKNNSDNCKKNNEDKTITCVNTIERINSILGTPDALVYRRNKELLGEDSLTVSVEEITPVWPPSDRNISKRMKINVIPGITVPGPQMTHENTSQAITGIKINTSKLGVWVVLKVNNGKLTINKNIPDGVPSELIDDNTTKKVSLYNDYDTEINNTFADSQGVIYQPDPNYSGEDEVNIMVQNGEKETIDSATIKITVNDNPVLIPEFVTTPSAKTIPLKP